MSWYCKRCGKNFCGCNSEVPDDTRGYMRPKDPFKKYANERAEAEAKRQLNEITRKIQAIEKTKAAARVAAKPALDMAKLEESVRLFFEGIGDDPNRDGIKDTPKRVAKVWAETMNGYTLKPEDFVTLFDNDSGYSGPVILRDAEFYTKCEHHLEPFSGTLDIAYQPRDQIIGLSKLLRIARVYAKRPQNQERLTSQIADALYLNLDAEWVAVRCRAEHYCMISRGTRIKGAHTETYDGRGDWPKDIFHA